MYHFNGKKPLLNDDHLSLIIIKNPARDYALGLTSRGNLFRIHGRILWRKINEDERTNERTNANFRLCKRGWWRPEFHHTNLVQCASVQNDERNIIAWEYPMRLRKFSLILKTIIPSVLRRMLHSLKRDESSQEAWQRVQLGNACVRWPDCSIPFRSRRPSFIGISPVQRVSVSVVSILSHWWN